jgi:hypothetical protein
MNITNIVSDNSLARTERAWMLAEDKETFIIQGENLTNKDFYETLKHSVEAVIVENFDHRSPAQMKQLGIFVKDKGISIRKAYRPALEVFKPKQLLILSKEPLYIEGANSIRL